MSRSKVDKVNEKSGASPEGVFEEVHAIMHLFRAEQYRALRGTPHELTHFEGKILAYFSRNPGATLSDLVAQTGRDKGQLARLIKSLKEQGLLEARSDEKDRRTFRLHLTSDGRRIHQSLHRQMSRVATLAVGNLNDRQREQLFELLQKVRLNLQPG